MGKISWFGLAEILIGAFLISPLDEGAITIISAGLGLGIVPFQLPITATIGLILMFDGLKRNKIKLR